MFSICELNIPSVIVCHAFLLQFTNYYPRCIALFTFPRTRLASLFTFCSPLWFRHSHSEIEKRRRDKMNQYINDLSTMIPLPPSVGKKPDKLTVLKFTVQHMKALQGTVWTWNESFQFTIQREDWFMKLLAFFLG